ncbi:hypothetical protein TWF694_008810 [Orbilia ellipsospora]|uniref:Uncharacterized protein n=1 Tax=Orbilia ellipsospora TaxID=2528407 RepID=A0AAV9XEH6_9PEZI
MTEMQETTSPAPEAAPYIWENAHGIVVEPIYAQLPENDIVTVKISDLYSDCVMYDELAKRTSPYYEAIKKEHQEWLFGIRYSIS